MWYVQEGTGQRQYTVPGSRHHAILESLPDWQPETGPAGSAAAESTDETPLPTPADLPGMTVAQLRALARALGVDAGFRTKGDLLAALTGALEGDDAHGES